MRYTVFKIQKGVRYMFKHVLLFKFIDPEVCAPVVGQKLLALKETVPEIVEIEYGLDELHKGRSYDAALIVTFKDKEGYLAYDKAPSHNEARVYIHQHVQESHTVDYEY